MPAIIRRLRANHRRRQALTDRRQEEHHLPADYPCPRRTRKLRGPPGGRHRTVKVDDPTGMFGRDRSVQSIRRHVLDCRDKRLRREGKDCPITYQA